MPEPISRRTWLRSGLTVGLGAMMPPVVPWNHPAVGASVQQSGFSNNLQRRLDELLAKHAMPGAVAGVYRDGHVATAASGIANLNTGASMRPDIGFLAGSITKVWTATLVMTFVDDGVVDLETPIREYVPHVRFRDPEATRTVTLRHLLNHSSGIDAGDFILDVGEGRAAHRVYVDAMADLEQIHRPGAYYSYCNGGWVLAAHVLEELTGATWHDLLAERVIRPLGATRTFPHAEDGVLFGLAIGSVPGVERGADVATPRFLLPKTFAAAGATLVTTIEDHLCFARMHMRNGVADDGTRVISAASARAMATRTVDLPTGRANGVGLGWAETIENGWSMLWHQGGSIGGSAYLLAIPEADVAYAMFVNSSVSGAFWSELHRNVLADVLGDGVGPSVDVHPRLEAGAVDLGRFVGAFRRMGVRVSIRRDGDTLLLTSQRVREEMQGFDAYNTGRPAAVRVVPVTENTLGLASTETPTPAWTFLEPQADGRFDLMYAGGRMTRRIDNLAQ